MKDTSGEVGTSSLVMYSCGPLHMDEQRQDVQLENTYSSYVPITGCSPEDQPEAMGDREVWRESGISVLIAWHDDDIYHHVVPLARISLTLSLSL